MTNELNGRHFPTRNRHAGEDGGERRGGGDPDPRQERLSGHPSGTCSAHHRTGGRGDHLSQGRTRLTISSVAWGFAEVLPNKVTILAETAERPEEIDVKRAQEAKQRAEEALKTGKTEADFTHAEDALEARRNPARSSGKEIARFKPSQLTARESSLMFHRSIVVPVVLIVLSSMARANSSGKKACTPEEAMVAERELTIFEIGHPCIALICISNSATTAASRRVTAMRWVRYLLTIGINSAALLNSSQATRGLGDLS